MLGEHRLVTLLGMGGVGKSRLSLQLGAEVLDDYPDGVWLVELAPVADAADVPQAVAAVLGVKEEPGGGVLDSAGALRARPPPAAGPRQLRARGAQRAPTWRSGCCRPAPALKILASSAASRCRSPARARLPPAAARGARGRRA